MATAILKYDPDLKKWQAWLGDKVVIRSASKEYVISMVLDGTRKKVQKLEIDKLVDDDGEEINYLGMIRASSFVQNTDTYAELVKNAIDARVRINGELASDMKNLRDLFSNVFYVERSEFTVLKDMLYYTGGWPSADSPPRLDFLFKQIATVMKFYTYFGRTSELKKYFKAYGLTITLDEKHVTSLDRKIDAMIAEDWFKCFGKDPLPKSKKEIGKKILDKAMSVQKEICELADSIKIHAASKASSKCNVKPENFINAVNTAARAKRTGQRSSSILYKAKMQHVVNEAALNEALDKNT